MTPINMNGFEGWWAKSRPQSEENSGPRDCTSGSERRSFEHMSIAFHPSILSLLSTALAKSTFPLRIPSMVSSGRRDVL